jgi:hypothetical protein
MPIGVVTLRQVCRLQNIAGSIAKNVRGDTDCASPKTRVFAATPNLKICARLDQVLALSDIQPSEAGEAPVFPVPARQRGPERTKPRRALRFDHFSEPISINPGCMYAKPSNQHR